MSVDKQAMTDVDLGPPASTNNAAANGDVQPPAKSAFTPGAPLEMPHDNLGVFEKKLVETMYRHTCKCLCGCICTMFLITLIVGGTGLMAFSTPSDHDWTIAGSSQSENLDALDDAASQADSISGAVADSTPARTKIEWGEALVIMYAHVDESTASTIFTPENVQTMCQLENEMLNHANYKTMCALDAPDGKCIAQPKSLMKFFYTGGQTLESWGYAGWDCTLLTQTQVDTGIASIQALITGTAAQRIDGGFYVSKDAHTAGFSWAARTQLVVGVPLAGYRNREDRWSKQREGYRDFMTEVEDKLFSRFGLEYQFFRSAYHDNAKTATLRVRWFALGILDQEFLRMSNGDLTLSCSAVFFVFAYIWFHTGSFWLTCTAMAQILMSLPVAFFVYRVIFQIKFFTQLHILAVFLVLGVGADDVFVLVDAWKQSALTCTDEHDRLLFSYHRASRSVFNTSFTTASAFLATALSPVMPISSFGIFAAIAIVLNYLFVCTATPCEVLVHHRRWSAEAKEKKKMAKAQQGAPAPSIGDNARSVSPKAQASGRDSERGFANNTTRSPLSKLSIREDAAPSAGAGDIELAPVGGSGMKDDPIGVPPAGESARDDPNRRSLTTKDKKSSTKLRRSEKFFRDWYVPILLYKWKGWKIWSWLIILGFGSYFVASVVWASNLQTPRKQEEWFDDAHMFNGQLDYQKATFLSASDDAYVEARLAWGIAGIDRSDYNIWVPDEKRGDVIFTQGFNLGSADAQTFMLNVCTELKTRTCNAGGCDSGTTPRTLVLPGGVDCWLEDFNTWYTNKTSIATLPTGATFFSELKLYRASHPDHAPSIGFINGELKYAIVDLTLSLQQFQPNFVTTPVHNELQDYVDDLNSRAPATLGRAQQTSLFWTWMKTEQGLVDGMWQGLIICGPVAFLVVCAATNNIVLGLYSLLCIAGIVSSVLGAGQHYMGWSLGIGESISAVIIIGLSVDFTLHLAHMYAESTRPSREKRTAHAAVTMGVTVIAGAITTLGAGMVMLFCQMQFFTKMAMLIVLTITFSIFTALLPFMALCAVIGPEGDFGKISLIAQRVWAFLRGLGGR